MSELILSKHFQSFSHISWENLPRPYISFYNGRQLVNKFRIYVYCVNFHLSPHIPFKNEIVKSVPENVVQKWFFIVRRPIKVTKEINLLSKNINIGDRAGIGLRYFLWILLSDCGWYFRTSNRLLPGNYQAINNIFLVLEQLLSISINCHLLTMWSYYN